MAVPVKERDQPTLDAFRKQPELLGDKEKKRYPPKHPKQQSLNTIVSEILAETLISSHALGSRAWQKLADFFDDKLQVRN